VNIAKRTQQLGRLISPIIGLISKTFKPNHNLWGFLLSDHQGFDGNLRALFDYVYQETEIRPYIIDSRSDNKSTLEPFLESTYPNVPIVTPNQLASGAFHLRLQTAVTVISHSAQPLRGLYDKTSSKTLNVWHGIPLKGMGNLDANFNRTNLAKKITKSSRIDFFCVSSPMERGLIAGCFLLDAEKIHVTGIPRNDWLTCSEDKLPQDLLDYQTRLKAQLSGRKLILYAPTFRDYDRQACGFTEKDVAILDSVLRANNAVMGIRAHPRDEGLFRPLIKNSSTILDMDYSIYPELTVLLRKTDLLITDYSSLWVDYLLRNKPVLGYVFDLERYQGSRGLMFDYQTVFPGPLCQTLTELVTNIETHLNHNERTSERQQWVKGLFHDDANSHRCEAVISAAREALNLNITVRGENNTQNSPE
jgi:CDP-glycerol glycerophosphotransferase (TagB/SpsB family)